MPLATVPNIHLASVGHWPAMTGPFDCTPEILASMVEAEADPGIRAPIIKLGHIDPRFDGQPAVGRIENLRLSDDGMDLYGDATGVPEWLAEIWGSAFPSRSIEASLDVKDTSGRKHKAILTGLALLGVQPPAIGSLEDIRALYEGDLVAAGAQMAMAGSVVRYQPDPPKGGRMPAWLGRLRRKLTPVAASVAIDDVYNEFYEAVPDGSWAWIRQVYSDYVIVDDGDGNLYQVPWAEVDGEVQFGDPVPGQMVFVPKTDDETDDSHIALAGDREGAVAFLSHIPDLATAEVRLAAGVPTEADQPGGSTLEITELLAEVGLPPEATQDQYRERLTELAAIANTPAPEVKPAAPAIPEGMVLVDSEVFASVQASATQGQAAFATLATQRRDEFIGNAVKLGKIPPARREHYGTLYDADEEGTRALIDSLAENIVPTSVLAGHTAASEGSADDALYKGLFGEDG